MTDTLGIDLGTTAIKIGRFDPDGRVVRIVARAYHDPSEHDVPPERIWQALTDATSELIGATHERGPIVGIGLASQTNSFLLLNEQSEPLTPVHLWTSSFADRQAEQISRQLGCEAIANTTGMMSLNGQYLAPKLLYLREHAPAIWSQIRSVWLLSDWITWRLCGAAVTDPSLWLLTGMYDLKIGGYWTDILELLDLSADQLPMISWAGRPAGKLMPEAARALGLPPGVPVAVGALDHLAAAIGVGNVAPGTVSISTGTATCVVVTHSERPYPIPDGVIGRHPADESKWFRLAWSGLSSSGLTWYARQAGGEHLLPDLLANAESASSWQAVPRNPANAAEGFDFRASDGHSDSVPSHHEAMGAILRCLTDELIRLLRLAAGEQRIQQLTILGGGARSDQWLRMIGDAAGITAARPECIDASVAGAAGLARKS